jgi:hypothetical protein
LTSPQAAAARTSIHVVWYVFSGEDSIGNDITWGIPLAMHATDRGAKADAGARKGVPQTSHAEPGGSYVCDGPVNLLAFHQCGFISAAEMQAALRGTPVAIALPGRWYSPGYYRDYLRAAPLTADEAKQAAALKVWTVYYEDRFHLGDARDSFPVAICFSEAEAQAELRRRGREVQPGGDGYAIYGPHALAREGSGQASEYGADAVREAIRRAAAREPGPVMVSG